MENKNVDIKALNEKIQKESAFIDLLMLEVNKVIVGQKYMIQRLLTGLLGKGHIYDGHLHTSKVTSDILRKVCPRAGFQKRAKVIVKL